MEHCKTFVFPHFVSSFVFVSVFNAHRKSVNCSVIRRATETGAHRFLFLCFIYQLFTYHVKRWRGLFGARCGLLSPWYVSSTTHRLSFFYMRTGTYNVLTVAVPCASFLNCDAKVQTYLQTCKHFPEKVCIFNLLQQIRLFLPKFIHILSTKTAKCAICKAKFFAFRLLRTYII